MLAVIALPRLALLLFTHLTSGPMITLARQWLVRYPGWPFLVVFLAAIVVPATLPNFVDAHARWIGGQSHRRIWRPWMLLSLLGVNMIALAFAITKWVPWLAPPNSSANISTLVRWLTRNPWATWSMVMLLLALAAYIGYRRVGNRTKWFAQLRRERARGWAMLYFVALVIPPLLGWLLPPVLFLFEMAFWWVTGDLFLFAITVGLACFGFYWTYKTVAEFRLSHGPAPDVPGDDRAVRSDKADPQVEDRGTSDTGFIRDQPVVRTAGEALFCLPARELGRLVRLDQMGRDELHARSAVRSIGRVDSGRVVHPYQPAAEVLQMEAVRVGGPRSFRVLVGADVGGGTGGGVVVVEQVGGHRAGWDRGGHDVVRPRARDDGRRRGSARGWLDRRLHRGGYARVAGELRRLSPGDRHILDGALCAVDLRPVPLVAGRKSRHLGDGGRVVGHFFPRRAGRPERKDLWRQRQ